MYEGCPPWVVSVGGLPVERVFRREKRYWTAHLARAHPRANPSAEYQRNFIDKGKESNTSDQSSLVCGSTPSFFELQRRGDKVTDARNQEQES